MPTLVESLSGVRVSTVSAGGAHSLVVTDSGTLYSFGGGQCGKLGHGDESSIFKPKVVAALAGRRLSTTRHE